MIFKKDDFMNKLANKSKYNLVGKLSNTMPKMELIKKIFIQQTELIGGAKLPTLMQGTSILIWTMRGITILYGKIKRCSLKSKL